MKVFTTKSCRILFCVCCLMLGATVYGQTVTVNGTVTDQEGQPLVGAAIAVINDPNTRGVSTDANGDFTLTVQSNATVTVSYIGYKPQTLQIPKQQKGRWIIMLTEDATTVDDVVVIGF